MKENLQSQLVVFDCAKHLHKLQAVIQHFTNNTRSIVNVWPLMES